MQRRRAASLVELIVILFACSVILSISGMLVRRAMLAQSETRACVDVERTLLRLSDQFQEDVHQSSAAVTDEASLGKTVFLQLQLSEDRQAEYDRLERSIERRLLHDGQVQAREEYSLPASADVTLREDASPRRVILTITAEPVENVPETDPRGLNVWGMPVSFQRAAVLGRDLRFTHHAAAPSQ